MIRHMLRLKMESSQLLEYLEFVSKDLTITKMVRFEVGEGMEKNRKILLLKLLHRSMVNYIELYHLIWKKDGFFSVLFLKA